MAPIFFKQGRADNNREAIRSFNYAKTAEAEHARLYSEALNNLASAREKSRRTTSARCADTRPRRWISEPPGTISDERDN